MLGPVADTLRNNENSLPRSRMPNIILLKFNTVHVLNLFQEDSLQYYSSINL